jgi:heat shock protein HslJ
MLLVVVFGLAACSPTDNDTRSATAGLPDLLQELTAQTWTLDDSPETTLVFSEDHEVSGQAPCNRYRGTFTVDEHSVEIAELSQTNRACDREAMDAEREYLDALAGTHEADATKPKRLVLTGDDGAELAFDAQDLAARLEGSWLIVNLAQGEALSTVLRGTEPTLSFAADGTLVARPGCNTFTTTWDLDGPRISIDAFGQTFRECADPDGVMDQDAAVAAALTDAKTVVVFGESLTLFDADGHQLVVADEQPPAEPGG